MRKIVTTALFTIALGIGSTQAAEVFVKVRPPAVVVEERGVAPSAQHVWIGGYQRWDGNAYAWAPGRWDVPPRPRAVWVGPRWRHRRGGYVFAEGRWR